MWIDVFKRTSDEWYPSFLEYRNGESLVRVSFTQTGPNPPIDGEWRVCAWGADDCGLEKDFTDEQEAWVCFLEVIGYEDVTMDSLAKLGFKSA